MLLEWISLMDVYRVVTLMGFLQGAILTALMWRHRKQQGGILIVYHLGVLSLVMLFPILEEGLGLRYTWPMHVLVCFLFQGLYLYVRHFQRPVRWQDWVLHLVLPAGVLTPLAYHIYKVFYQVDFNQAEGDARVTFFSILKIAINLGYAAFTLRLLRRHRLLTHSMYSETSRVDLAWVSRLIVGFFLILVAGALLYFAARFGGWSLQMTDMLTYAGLLAYLYYAYTHAVHQTRLLPLAAPAATAVPDEQPKSKYARSTLSAEQGNIIYDRIREVMERQELYRDSDLTLPTLAEAAGAPGYHISQVLSEQAGVNFYDFVNRYRVEAAKRLLLDPTKKHYTVLAIAYESGFNSKTTFNKVFRKSTGQTPTEYVAEALGRMP